LNGTLSRTVPEEPVKPHRVTKLLKDDVSGLARGQQVRKMLRVNGTLTKAIGHNLH
jgi:hypothetical protein